MQDLLLMRDHSLISAEAFSTANGGNINIDTDFIVAVTEENSDIIANAFEGNGVTLTSQPKASLAPSFGNNGRPLVISPPVLTLG